VSGFKTLPRNSQEALIDHNSDSTKKVVFSKPTMGFQELNQEKFDKQEAEKNIY